LVGIRGSLLSEIRFDETLATQHLIFNPCFQTPLDEALSEYVRLKPGVKITEDILVLVELEAAVTSYGDHHAKLVDFIHYLLSPTDQLEDPLLKIPGGSQGLQRFRTMFSDAFVLSFMAGEHPLDIFQTQSQRSQVPRPPTPMFRFLLYLRDAAKVRPTIVPDEILFNIVERWNENKDGYDDVLLEIERLEDREANNNDYLTDRYQNACFYGAVQLATHGVSLAFLLDKLSERIDAPPDSATWNNNEALLLYLRQGEIQIAPTDLLGVHKIQDLPPTDFDKTKASCGLIVPNPIWNESVLERLEYLVGREDVKETELQMFFEMYPEFILNDLQVTAIPQVVLLSETHPTLRPDFVIQRSDSKLIDIVELKRPIRRLITGTDTRPSITRSFARAVAQLKEYKRWFQSERNQAWFRATYGLEGYEPTLTMIIGRSFAFRNEKVRRLAVEGLGVNVLTYDDLIEMKRRRRKLVFG